MGIPQAHHLYTRYRKILAHEIIHGKLHPEIAIILSSYNTNLQKPSCWTYVVRDVTGNSGQSNGDHGCYSW
jgi:hypothetical protein